ncbi:ABC transporter ATP-binding protein [bacterium]|jgi:branched-chain amino acid transport system ATP-binding protein|nr:ABC transporter ATP-binding protein [bacterium]
MSKVLEVKNLVINYGAIQAVKGIDITVKEGQIVALLGANGAGKTSVLKAISGMAKVTKGEILFEGKNIANRRAYAIARMGLSQSPEGRLILMGLTVEENLRVGAYGLKTKKFMIEGKEVSKSAKAQLLENMEKVFDLFPILKERRKQQASTLSGGEQQMLAIGRALMASPKILLLDEPSLGLAPLIIKDIFETLVKIRASGTSILIVEQNALATLKIADYAYVLELGTISMHGLASDLINDERLVAAYLGGKK